ncbi:MAG: hypothetical protein ACREPD_01170 [Stenotrophomonas sp.]|uniref:hypothetical protein n=1 Tax=Stenotrophomonas sp. TaxID=69392 RepID=UPI003D6CCE25
MKKLLWMLLAALPVQALAHEEDPIAYKCYYCTPGEMEGVALAKGIGQHYVYDAKKLTIVGYNVSAQDGVLRAESFAPESWVQAQFLGFMDLYFPDNGLMIALIGTVRLFAPGTEHGRNSRYLWGQDLTALNPHHLSARELVRRYLNEHEMLKFLDTSASGGKLLKLEYMLDENYPIFAAMHFSGRTESSTTYYFDRDARLWRYLNSHLPQSSSSKLIQERREDFAPIEGRTTVEYSRGQGSWAEAFKERATWAGIPVHGELPEYGATRFNCERAADDIQCYIE